MEIADRRARTEPFRRKADMVVVGGLGARIVGYKVEMFLVLCSVG